MNTFLSVLSKLDTITRTIIKYIAIAMFMILMIILSLNILNRFLPVTSFHWLDEIVELCFAAMVFYGAASVWITGGHFSAGDWIYRRVPAGRGKTLYRLLLEAVNLLFMVILFTYSWNLMNKAGEVTAIFQIPKQFLYVCIPVSSAIMCVYSIARIVKEIVNMIKGGSSGEEETAENA